MGQNNKLQESAKLTNITIPYSKYIDKSGMPEQDLDLLGNIISVKYKDQNHRLDSKEEYENRAEFEKKEFKEYEEEKVIVVRCDKVEPYVMICISLDYKHILVYHYKYYNEQVAIYPQQQTSYIGTESTDIHYFYDHDIKTGKYNYLKRLSEEKRGLIVRLDYGEPCYAIIMEYMDDNTVRFILSDEVEMKVTPNKEKSEEEIMKIRKENIGGKNIANS